MPTKTPAQVVVDEFDGSYSHELPAQFDTYRKIRRHPTIHLARQYAIAPTFLEPWSFVGDDESLTSFVEALLQPFRTTILRTAMHAYHDFGWKGYELVWEVDDPPSELGDRVGPRKLLRQVKPLRNDDTYQRIDPNSGKFLGLRHTHQYTGADVYLTPEQSLFLNFDVEGIGEYGTGSSEIARESYNKWCSADEGAARYDEKVAGAYRICEYPTGTTMFKAPGESEAKETDNAIIADHLLNSLKSSGQARIPVKVKKNPELTGESSKEKTWNVFILSAGGGAQPSFISRLKYLDALLLRSHGLPERSLTEGSFGTKAEAEAHGDAALLVIHQVHERIVEAVNQQIVDPCLSTNFNAPGAVEVQIGDMTKESREAAKSAFTSLLPLIANEVVDSVDIESLIDAAGLPRSSVEQQSFTIEEVEEKVS